VREVKVKYNQAMGLYLGHWACDGMSARPGATQRLSLADTVADQDGFSQSGSRGVRSGDKDDTEVRSSWQQRAPAGEQEQEVTQLVAHSISDGNQSSALHRGPCEDFCEEGAGAVARSLSQFWQAGDAVGSALTTAGLPISMAEFNNRHASTDRN